MNIKEVAWKITRNEEIVVGIGFLKKLTWV